MDAARAQRVCLAIGLITIVTSVGRKEAMAQAPPPPNPPPGDQAPDNQAAVKEAVDDVEELEKRIQQRSLRIKTLESAGEIARAGEAVDEQDNDLRELVERADEVTKQPPSAPSVQGPKSKTEVASAAAKVAEAKKSAKESVDKDRVEHTNREQKIGCNGRTVCLFGGALLGSYSLTLGQGTRAGQTSHHIISLVVPAGGFRYVWNQYLNLDVGLYTAIISPQFEVNTVATSGTGCTKGGAAFEDKLPCEGNAPLRPYLAGLVALTIGTGSSTLGVISVGFTAGVARTNQDPTGFDFYGLFVGTGGVYGTVPLRRKATDSELQKSGVAGKGS
jgi:hypothetical protein